MKLLIKELKTTTNITDGAIFYFDLEDLEMLELCNLGVNNVIRYIEARTSYNSNSPPNSSPASSMGKIYLFIDEIQYLNNASSFIKLMVVGLDVLRYWRTQSKQEIDFVIQHQKQVFTLEVKKVYSGQKTTSLEYFSQKYPNSKKFIITLEKRRETKGDISLFYPWEIFSAFAPKL